MVKENKSSHIIRLAKVKDVIGKIDYTIIYAYEFDEKLTQSELTRIRNFWNFKITDAKLLNRFEWIAENIHRIPNIAKVKKT